MSIIATGQAEHLIITMPTKNAAKSLTVAIFLAVLLISSLSIVFFELTLKLWFQSSSIKYSLSLLIALNISLVSVNQTIRSYATYLGEFRCHGMAAILNSIGITVVSLGYPILIDDSPSVLGLILGQTTGLAFSVVSFALYTDILRISKKNILLAPRTFYGQLSKLPRLLVMNLSRTMCFRLPVLIVGAVASSGVVGVYAMAERITSIPTGILGSAIGQVFRHRFRKDFADKSRNISQPRQIIKTTSMLALLGYSTFIWLADWLVLVFLGEKWAEIVPFVRIIAILEMVSFVFYSTEDIAIIRGSYNYRMLWQSANFLTLAILYCTTNFTDFLSGLGVKGIVIIMCAVRSLLIIYDISKTWQPNITNIK